LIMRRHLVSLLSFFATLALTVGLSWFAISNYRSAAPLAEENLRGLALTLAGAMEGLAGRDDSTDSLASLLSPEVAYAELISADGITIFHTNPDLVGLPVGDRRYRQVLETGRFQEERVRLGTGEIVYEFQSPFHFKNRTCVLRLALHTWRADAVMRRARWGLTVIFSLLVLGWGLGLATFLLLKRQALQRKEVERHRELARLGEVGAVLAHEIRTPLAGIKGFGQLLEERLPVGREHDFANLIVGETKRLEGLVNDLLLYTRTLTPFAGSTPLGEACSGVLTLLESQLAAAEVRAVCHIPPELRVVCSEDGLRRVLLNLLTNAMQASPAGGLIEVKARVDGNFAELTVADQGEGIPPELRPELFLPFRTGKARGTGLGLAICKKIVGGCGGDIEAEEAAGGGALFRVRLPRAG